MKDGRRTVGLITARGGSKSIPGKNIKLLGGKPLIAWTIGAALESKTLDRVIVSTDDEEIASVSRDCGAEVPFSRPVHLSLDDSPHIDVVCHAVRWLESDEGTIPDYLMLLQPTSPFRTNEDIDAASHLSVDRQADSVVSVCQTRDHPFLVREIAEDGTLAEIVPISMSYPRRQDLPAAYALNGAIYLTRCGVLLEQQTFFPAQTLPYIMPASRSLDIDEPWDFRLASLIAEDENGQQPD